MDNHEEISQLRSNLSTMSFAEIQDLQNKLGLKKFNEVLFDCEKSVQKSNPHKAKNKIRKDDQPIEMSAKRPGYINLNLTPAKKNIVRDPRFDPLCGNFDKKKFHKSYQFIEKIRQKECEKLKSELSKTYDPEKKKEKKICLQRLLNQNREAENRRKKEEAEYEEKKNMIDLLKQGKHPKYKKKSEKKMLDLVNKFEELKKSGKLKKHLEKQRKKKFVKDRKKLSTMISE